MTMERPDSIERRESKEKLNENLRKFIYQDNHDNRKIIFECLAENINEADKLYEEKTGIKPEKQSHIACEIKKFNSSSGEWEDVWR